MACCLNPMSAASPSPGMASRNASKNGMLWFENSMFSSKENRRRTPPDSLGVEATVYLRIQLDDDHADARIHVAQEVRDRDTDRAAADDHGVGPHPRGLAPITADQAWSPRRPTVWSRQRAPWAADYCRTVTAWPIRFA